MAGPTRGATESNPQTWTASPWLARAVRVGVAVAPIVVAWSAVAAASPAFWRPDRLTVVAFLGQALPVASGAAYVADLLGRRLLPLATLLGMTLTFPDRAPSRFTIALRAGTVRKLSERLEQARSEGLGDDVGEAAARAIELVTLLGRHERLTRGHTERVRAHAVVIGTELGLPDHDLDRLAWAALLHDIGKLTVPAEILNGGGRPTEEEWKILQNHPAAGEAFVEPLAGWLGDWRLATSQHHERWDGTGYPNALAGRDISLAGRIVAVADAYDVITSRRSYKAPMSADAARAELVKCAGTQFDPEMVRAVLRSSLGRQSVGHRAGWLSQVPELVRSITSAGVSGVGGAVAPVLGVGAVLLGTATGAGGFQAADRAEPQALAMYESAPIDDRTTSTTAPAGEQPVTIVPVETGNEATPSDAEPTTSMTTTDPADPADTTDQMPPPTTTAPTPSTTAPAAPAPTSSTTRRGVSEVVDDVTDDLGDTLGGVADPVLDPVLDEVVDPVLDPVLEEVVDPVVDPLLDSLPPSTTIPVPLTLPGLPLGLG